MLFRSRLVCEATLSHRIVEVSQILLSVAPSFYLVPGTSVCSTFGVESIHNRLTGTRHWYSETPGLRVDTLPGCLS